MKTCKKCEQRKPLEEFQKCARNKDGHTGMCKVCKRKYDNAHYKANPERRQYIRANSYERMLKNKDYIWDYLSTHPCIDCGEKDPVVLEFDHRENKVENIAVMVHENSLAKLKTEIAKCDVRCANCHRRKTAIDFGWWKMLRSAQHAAVV